ncbi:hypothetical protein Celaphus_00008377 [Cervus elaphus hippelaphus]|uniref:SUI1 domain-containing protein n=1 Tax=Cervus elaphus hippelaphus TaxID=46360 RepID=A0A212CQ74_CEREH|nr:hypothetical protein Celaphus_00008377 [Cervus elaphus hippelaphus]
MDIVFAESYQLGFYAHGLNPDKIKEYTCRYKLDDSQVYNKEPASVTNEKITCQGHIFAKTGQVIVVDYSLDLGKTYSKRFLKVTSKDCVEPPGPTVPPAPTEDLAPSNLLLLLPLVPLLAMIPLLLLCIWCYRRISKEPTPVPKPVPKRCNQMPLMWCPPRNMNLQSFNPFADASKGNDLLPAGTEDYSHIRINREMAGRPLLLSKGSLMIMIKRKLAFKKKFTFNGTVIEHPEYGEIIQLQGNQRKNICQFLHRCSSLSLPELHCGQMPYGSNICFQPSQESFLLNNCCSRCHHPPPVCSQPPSSMLPLIPPTAEEFYRPSSSLPPP